MIKKRLVQLFVFTLVLSMFTLLASCTLKNNDSDSKSENSSKLEQESKDSTVSSEKDEDEIVPITIYYPDEQFNDLLSYKKELKPDPLVVLQEVLSSEKNKDVFDDDTKLLGVEVKDRIAYVNFNERYDHEADGAFIPNTRACMRGQTIDRTLCSNKTLNIDKVTILINGEAPEEFDP